jgi:pyrroloquinoline quinone biosynthesis protein D
MSGPPRTDTRRPALARGVRLSRSQGRPVLLAPERVVELDEIAGDVLARCDGALGLSELVDALARDYEAPKEEIAADVGELLGGLAVTGLVTWVEPP